MSTQDRREQVLRRYIERRRWPEPPTELPRERWLALFWDGDATERVPIWFSANDAGYLLFMIAEYGLEFLESLGLEIINLDDGASYAIYELPTLARGRDTLRHVVEYKLVRT